MVSSGYMGILSGVRSRDLLQKLVSAYKNLYLDINLHYYMEFLARKQSAKVSKYLGFLGNIPLVWKCHRKGMEEQRQKVLYNEC